jgi:hypothetical protein
MANHLCYRNCVILVQSFELMNACGWIPRFTLTCPDRTLLSRDRLDEVFSSKDDADKFALGEAMNCIDDREPTVAEATLSLSETTGRVV